MKQVNWSNYKFHCSGLHHLMVKSRSKSDPLSETTKSYLREIYIQEVFDRRKVIVTPATQKGTLVEAESLDLVSKVSNVLMFKNTQFFENDFICGTPDVAKKSKQGKFTLLLDTKSSWDIWTFAAVDENKACKDYFFQLLGYMALLKINKATLAYCLVNTPDDIWMNEMERAAWKRPELDSSDEAVEEFKRNFIFDDIAMKDRVKRFCFEWNGDLYEQLVAQIQLSREFLKGLSL